MSGASAMRTTGAVAGPWRGDAAPPRVAVVGGGAGGLVAAGRLARAGCAVTLLEQSAEVGGRMQSIALGAGDGSADAWRFDAGPSLMLFKEKYEAAFASLGVDFASVVDAQRVERAAYRVHFVSDQGSGSTGTGSSTSYDSLDLLYDVGAMAAQCEAREAGAGAAYRRWLAMARRHLAIGVPLFIDEDLDSPADVAALAGGLARSLPKVGNPWELLAPHDAVMRTFFKDEKLRAALTFQDLVSSAASLVGQSKQKPSWKPTNRPTTPETLMTDHSRNSQYVGLTPASAPGVFSLLAATEISADAGVHYPVGGFSAVRNKLRRAVEACGAEVRTGAGVAAILVDERGAANGVELESGERVAADVVLCNRDLPAAHALLRGEGASAARVGAYAAQRSEELGKMEYSAGVIAYCWALRGARLGGLLHHNTFLSLDDAAAAWRPARAPAELPLRPNFYVHCPSRTDASAAPAGENDSVMVLLPVANEAGGAIDYAALAAVGKERVLSSFVTAGLGNVGAHICAERVIAPPDWRAATGVRHGAAFGLAHGLGQLSALRPGLKDARIAGLYFVGASTRPGNGVPLCFESGRLAAERVLRDLAAGAARSSENELAK